MRERSRLKHAKEYLDAYLDAAGLWAEKKAPLFQSIRHGKATGNKLTQPDVYRMIQLSLSKIPSDPG